MIDRRLLHLARHHPHWLAATLLAGTLRGLTIIAQAACFSRAVAAVFPGPADLPRLRTSLLGLLLAIVLRALFSLLGDLSAARLARRVKSNLRARLLAHLDALGPTAAASQSAGAWASALTENLDALDPWFGQYLPQLLLAALIPGSILLAVFPRDALSGVILLLTAPLIPFFMVLIGQGAARATRRQWDTLQRLSAHFLDSLQGLTTLKAFGWARAHAASVARASQRFRDATLSVLRLAFLSALTLELLSTLSTAIIAVAIGLRLLHGGLPFETALFLLVLAPEFYLPLRMLGTRFHAGVSGQSAAESLFALLEQPLPAAAGRSGRLPAGRIALRLEAVTFRHPDAPQPALQSVTCEIPAGQHTVLIGPSGSGKSTLFQLLLAFRQPTSGRILVNGQDLGSLDPQDWHARLAWVPQQPYLFDDTLEANLRLANPEASAEELQVAVRAAGLEDVIAALPQGYATRIGERGVRLSGGQAQRLALARAFLRHADLVLLDEPDASLDAANAATLHTAIQALRARGVTVITIAHRPETVRAADQVVLLKDGQVQAVGTPSALQGHPVFAHWLATARAPKAHADQAGSPARAATFTAESAPPAERPIPVNGGVLRRLLGFLRANRGEVALSVLLGALTVGSNVSLLAVSAWLLSAAALQPSVADLQVAIVGVRFFGITRGVFRYLERLVSHGVTFQLLARLREWFYRALEPLAPARLEDWHSGDLLTRITADVERLQDFYVRAVAPPLAAILLTVAVSAWLGSLAPTLGLLLPLFLVLVGVVLPLTVEQLARRASQHLLAARARLGSRLVDHLQGLPDLLANNRAADHRVGLLAQAAAYDRAFWQLAVIQAVQRALSDALGHLGMWALLLAAADLTLRGQLDGRLLAAVALGGLAAFEAVTPLSQAAQTLRTSLQAAARLFAVVDAPPVVSDPPQPALPPRRPSLRLQQVGFTYPGRPSPALQGLDLHLEAGQRIGLVGPSGAGKSTLLALLLRFREYEGEIWLDGRPLRAYAQDDVRRMFALVPQQTHLFNATLRENLLLARPDADEGQLEHAAAQAQLLPLLDKLSNGWDTFLGSGGWALSGGERQRVGIARALLKDAPILLLDEPTASLDPLTASAIENTLLAISRERAVLWISHRLTVMPHMDCVLVLDGGRVVERGSHTELLAANGLYARLWRLSIQ